MRTGSGWCPFAMRGHCERPDESGLMGGVGNGARGDTRGLPRACPRASMRNAAYDRQRCHSPTRSALSSGSPSAPACWARCSLMPRTGRTASPTCQHGAARRAGGRPERAHPPLCLRFWFCGALTERPSGNCRFYLSRDTLASLPGHHPACAHRQQSAGRRHPRRHRLLARDEPRLQSAVGRQRIAWPGRALSLPGKGAANYDFVVALAERKSK